MDQSILNSIKKLLNIEADYTEFDVDIMMHINTVLSILSGLGIGPINGFMIEGAEETWEDFLGVDNELVSVKSYVYLRVRLLFDPPATSFHINSMEEQIREIGWRLNVTREGREWVDPDPKQGVDVHERIVIDGGTGY